MKKVAKVVNLLVVDRKDGRGIGRERDDEEHVEKSQTIKGLAGAPNETEGFWREHELDGQASEWRDLVDVFEYVSAILDGLGGFLV